MYKSDNRRRRKNSKARNKRRKPKFLSLSLELSKSKSQPLDHGNSHDDQDQDDKNNPHQLNLFPLHPENLVDEKDSNDESVARFFSGTEDSATTLTELLTSSSKCEKSESEQKYDYMAVSSSKSNLRLADIISGQQGALVRTAMRNKGRVHKDEEEKWVVYSDVVENSTDHIKKEEEVSSCNSIVVFQQQQQQQQLSLKLDYDEILNAWSDKGSLFLQPDSPQIVPDIHEEFFASHGLVSCWDNSTHVLHRVPEIMATEQSGIGTATETQEDDSKVGRREASVLRYKEKRNNRLFSKRIRYEVRKINAEKRPRIKGRFVKRD